jgi:hypothetical protein
VSKQFLAWETTKRTRILLSSYPSLLHSSSPILDTCQYLIPLPVSSLGVRVRHHRTFAISDASVCGSCEWSAVMLQKKLARETYRDAYMVRVSILSSKATFSFSKTSAMLRIFSTASFGQSGFTRGDCVQSSIMRFMFNIQ